jgi:hypothetical protein
MADETTTIEIKVSTWQALNARKRPGDSFDDVIVRQLGERQATHPPGQASGQDGPGHSHSDNDSIAPTPTTDAIEHMDATDATDTTGTPEGMQATDGQQATQQAENGRESAASGPPVPGSVPQRIDTAAAQQAIQAAVEYVHDNDGATMRELVRAVMPAHALGYDVPDLQKGDRYRGSWWRKVIKPGLQEHPDVRAPKPHESEWKAE